MQMLIAPSDEADRNLVGCPALFHNLTNFAVVLSLVLTEHSGCFRVSRRIWVLGHTAGTAKGSTAYGNKYGILIRSVRHHPWPKATF